MEKRKLSKEFLRYSSLNIMGMIGLSCYILVDTFFVSLYLGSKGLAALNIAIPVYNIIHGSGLMLGVGGSTKFSIYKAQNDTEKSNYIFSNTVITALIISVLFIAVGIIFSRNITLLLGADKEVFNMTNIYIKLLLIFSPFFIMNEIMLCFIRNDGNPDLPMIAMIMGSVSNIILDYVFMKIFHWGMFGAVFATGFSPIISMGIMSLHFIKRKNTFTFKKNMPSVSLSANICALGIPSFITEVSAGIVIIVFNFIFLDMLGNTGVAAYGVIANLWIVAASVFTGLAQGIQPIVSKNYGCGNTDNMKYVLKLSITALIFISASVYAVCFFFAAPITNIFNSEGSQMLYNTAVSGLKLYFSAVFFAGFNTVISMYFTSCDKAVPAYAISLLRGTVIIIPAAFIMSSLFGTAGAWLSFTFTEGIVAAISLVLYKKTRR